MPLSPTAEAQANAPYRNEVWVALLEINHSSLGAPIRLAGNTEDVSSGGNLYTASNVEIALPDDVQDQLPTVTLRVGDVEQNLLPDIRSLTMQTTARPTAALSFVLASTPNTIEAGPFQFEVLGAKISAQTIDFTLGYQNLLAEAFPGLIFSPAGFPSLF